MEVPSRLEICNWGGTEIRIAIVSTQVAAEINEVSENFSKDLDEGLPCSPKENN